MNKIITLIMLLTSISFSQVNTMYHDGTDCNCDSIHQVYFDKYLFSETPYINGSIKGIFKIYNHENEIVSVSFEGLFVNGNLEGIAKSYFDDGSLSKEIPFVNGKENGIEKEYFDNGSLYSETPYLNGEKNGTVKVYFGDGSLRSGSLRSTAKYKNGVLDGYKHCSDGRIGNESLKCAL